MVSEINRTIFSQINGKELRFAKFNIMIDGDNTLIIKKGKKYISITYNSMDLYDVVVGSYNTNFQRKEKKYRGLYADQLRPLIEKHFKFEYVMDGIMRHRR